MWKHFDSDYCFLFIYTMCPKKGRHETRGGKTFFVFARLFYVIGKHKGWLLSQQFCYMPADIHSSFIESR